MAGLSLQFEWDPGCSCCLLSASTWERIVAADSTLQLQQAPLVIAANNQPMNVLGKLVHNIQLPNNTTFKWPFIVVKGITADGFIGSDLMQASYAITDHAHNVVYFNSSKDCSPILSNCTSIPLATAYRTQNLASVPDQSPSAKVYLTSSVHIKPQCKRIVSVSPPESWVATESIVEPDNDYFNQKGLMALPGTSTRISQNDVNLALLNMSDQTVTLTAGDHVGTIHCAHQISEMPPLKIEQMWGLDKQPNPTKCETEHQLELPFEINLNSTDLTSDEMKTVKHLLVEFKDIFSGGPYDIGCTKLLQHTIDTSSDKPILQRPRRLPIHVQAEVQMMIEDMVKCGIIQPSRSPWCAPIVVVTKKNGTKRLCVDFRKLNNITVRDSYPLPRIEDVLNVLAGCRYFSALDMKSGYHQVEVAPADRPKTAFSVGTGLYEWIRMPFGLVNAPATFSRLMCTLLADLSFEEVISYLDDVLIYSKTFNAHLTTLRRVFSRFREANLKLSPEKCKWFQKQTEFLGYLITENGVRTHPDKIEKIKFFSTPSNIKAVRSFLGLASYYRRYVHQFAKIAHPLTQLLRKDASKNRFMWTSECETSFQTLKSKLVSAPILALPCFGKPFKLYTDASDFAVGCVLEQVQGGKSRVIAYASQVLTPNKRKWSAFQREAYALLWASRKFRPYILGGKVTFITDHAPLTYLRKMDSIPEKVQAYFLELEQYDYTLEHRPGKQHGNADTLSRIPADTPATDCTDAKACLSINLPSHHNTDWLAIQNVDDNLRIVKEWVLDGKPKRKATSESEELGLLWNVMSQLYIDKDSGILYRLSRSGKHQFVVPHHQREAALKTFHDLPTAGHRGVTQTYDKIREQMWWPKLKEDVSYWCNSCSSCARFKSTNITKAPYQSLLAGHPHEVVAIDFVGPMSSPTSRNNVYLLVMVDYFTRYAEAIPLPDRQASTVARAIFTEWISRHGIMEVLHSDQAQEFESDLLAEICTLLHIKKSRSSPFHPEGNSVCERLNGTLLSILKPCMLDHPDDWDTLIPNVLMAYRSTRHSSTGFTPNYLLTGREMRLPAHVIFPAPDKEPILVTDYARKLRWNLMEAFRSASNHLQRSHELTRDKSEHYARYRPYEIGDLVYVLTPKGSRGKLGEVWNGPWKIVARTGVIYTLTWCHPSAKRKKTRRYHFNLLKYCLPRQNRWTLQDSQVTTTLNTESDLHTEDALLQTAVDSSSRRRRKAPDRFGDWDYSD